ncbi:protein kinase domain-containing protein [Ilumatobacter sp.]|uniref:nSTAND1 domain-containing NTPase n=1 Tax=Ilumatobacter sp. TaxID=1967498 RepID=UPI003C3C41B7
MQICVLGSVTLGRDGREAPLGPQVRRLFARLVVDHDRVVSTDRLVDCVWNGDPPAGAQRSLKTYVSRLRQSIDPERSEVLVYSEPGYRLSLDGHSLDSRAFEFELDEAVQAVRLVDHGRAIALLTSALGRWHGDAYVEFAHEEWARPEAVRLEERKAEASELLIEALLGAGETEPAVAQAQSLARSEPLRERPRELLMRSLYIAGRQPEALREYRAFRRMLSEDVGLDPSGSLVDLERRIAIRDSSLDGLSQPVRGYELRERIGRGTFAVVHRAVQPGVRRDVAIKIIRAPLADRPAFVRDFEHEAHVVASVEHPHVVPLYDFWREPGAAFLVMRLMRGGSVEDSLRAHGAFSTAATVDLLREIGPALEAAHDLGVVHRDVRPANMLLDHEGAAYLADFGIAVWTPTGDGDALATAVDYASPEVLRGEPIAATADIHSLGVTIFELLTGQLPFAGSSDRAELVRRQLTEPLPSLLNFSGDLPVDLDEIIGRATAKDPADRYPSVESLVDDVVEVLDSSRPIRRDSRRWMVDNPYVGLHAFGERDAARFHGREALVAEVVERLEDQPLVVLVGPSGSGKSSVVRAGLVSALRTGVITGSENWFVTTMVPGADPIDAFEAALLRVAVNPPTSLRSQLNERSGLLRAVRRILPDDDTTLLVVLDQFEELFTLTALEDERDRFLHELAHAVRAPSSPLRIVATLRADHYDEPLANAAFAELVTDGTVTVRPLEPAELEEVVVLPARSVGVEVEPALTAELVASASKRPASLPLLQFALTETFRRRTSDVMSLATFNELGGLTGAIAARADHIVDSAGEAEVAEARRILGRLVTLDETGGHSRRRALISELGDDDTTTRLIEQLVEARLLTVDRDGASREPTVEVAHEALLRDWPRLRRWLEEDRENLRALREVASRSDTWLRSGRDDAELARGGRLIAAQVLAEERPDLLNATELDWVTASIREQDREAQERLAAMEHERRQNRQLRGLLGAAAVLLVLSVGAASIALVLRRNAVDNERDAITAEARASANADAAAAAEQDAETNLAAARDAEREAQASAEDAEIERLVALSAAQIYVSPDRAMLLALEANRRRDDAVTRGAVQRSIATEPRLSRVVPVGDDVRAVALSDDATVALVARENDVSWVDIATGEPTGATFSTDDSIYDLRASANGTTAAVATDSGGTVLTHILRADGAEVTVLAEHEGYPRDYSGDTLVLDSGGTVGFVDAISGSVRVEIPVDDFYVVLSPNGERAAVVYDPFFAGGLTERRTEILDVATGQVLAVLDEPEFVNTIALADAGTLVTGYVDGTISLRNVSATGVTGSTTTLTAHSREVTSIGVAPDGSFVSAGGDRTLRFWSPDGALIGDPVRVSGAIVDAAFGTDGRVVATQGSGGPLVFEIDHRAIVDDRFPASESTAVLSPTSPWAARISDDRRAVTYTRVDDPTEQHVHDLSEVHPNGALDLWSFSPDGEWVLTVDAESTADAMGTISVSSIDGDRRTTLDGADLVERLDHADQDRVAPRLGPRGEEFLLQVEGTDGNSTMAWFDADTGEMMAGPTRGPAGDPMVLGDGSIVRSSFGGPVEVLSPELKTLRTIDGTDDWRALHQNPTSGLVVATGGPGELALIEPSTGDLVFLTGLAGEVASAAFSPTGDLIAATSTSEGVQLFDVASAQPIGVPMVPSGQATGGIHGIRWSSDGAGVWIAPSGGPVRFVTDPARWREIACEAAGRELTTAEWKNFVSETEPHISACT